MATKAGFKQQCPHCEARVPIRDEKLIGEEIKCPKCKQPFVVEDLGDADSDSAPAAAPAGKVKKKKDQGGPKGVFKDEDDADGPKQPKKAKPGKKRLDLKTTKLVLVGGLTAVALVFLGVALFLMRGGDNKPAAGPQVAAGGGPAPAPTPAKKKAEAPAKAAPAEPPAPTSMGNPANLLPGDSEIVLNVQMQEMLKNPLGRMVFEPASASRALSFESRHGFPIEDVERWIAAGRYSMEWVFEVIRTNKPIAQGSVRKALRLKPAEAPIQGQEYFVTTYNWLEAGSPVRYLMRREPPAAAPGSRPLALRFADATTMVFGDVAPVEEFLKVKGQFPRQPNPPGAPPGSGSYATINPKLRAVLDRVESKPPILFSFALSVDSETRPNLELGPVPVGDTASVAAVSARIKEKINLVAAFDCRSDANAKTLWSALSALLKKVEALAKAAGIDVKVTQTRPREEEGGGQPGAREGRGAARPVRGGGGGGGPPPASKAEKKASAQLNLRMVERSVDVAAELDLTQEIYERLVKVIEPYLVRSQSEIEMTLAHPSTHELGGALRQYAVEHKQFPPGAVRRAPSPARANRPWPPDRRVSWMSELLPYLGFEGLYTQIKPQRSWQDPENMTPAVTVVPAFLDPANPHSSRYVRYPGMDYDVAATHFVGIAGVGQDAAEYSASDPATAAKLGVFGYDRYTRLSDLTDGLTTTIVAAEAPPVYKSPWIAGGGSTIRGVPETRSIQPFVSATVNGRRGTVVVMADGSVRFLAENTSDEVFKALCVVKKSGDKIRINKVAPLVPKPVEEPDTKAQATPADGGPK